MSIRVLRPISIAAALVATGIVAMAVHANAGPAQSGKRATILAGGAAKVSLVPPTVTDLNATLADYTGVPIPGATITFSTHDGVVMCKAHTNRKGFATCDDTNTVVSLTGLQSGYIATFAGNNAYLPATGYGNVQPL